MSHTPLYTAEPGPDERRLGLTARSGGALGGPSSTLIQRGDGITVALKNQREDARLATYGRKASVAGEVTLSSTQAITSVIIRVRQSLSWSL